MSHSDALQIAYDDAMFAYTQGEYAQAESAFRAMVEANPEDFDARLSLAMCLYRQGDFLGAIAEGHRAERLKPNEQLVHTNLSLFYMKSGDKTTAEKHGLQARIASWKEDMAKPPVGTGTTVGEASSRVGSAPDSELLMAQPKLKAFKLPEKFPDMPWKKQAKS